MLFILGWLIHIAIFGTLGWLILRNAGVANAKPIGYVVGGLIPGGVLVLILVWLFVKFQEKA